MIFLIKRLFNCQYKKCITKYSKLQNLLSNVKTIKLDVGQEINGTITKIVAQHGLFVDLGVFGIAQLHITNVVEKWKEHKNQSFRNV